MTRRQPLPSGEAIRQAWAGKMRRWFPARESPGEFHDTALFTPTSPPGHWAFARLRLLATLELTLSLPGKTVLDVAAGSCILAAGLSHAGRQVSVNDLRPLEESLNAWNIPPETRIFNRDVFALSPEEIGRFDIVLCNELIEHVAHPDKLLCHLREILEPEGHLVLTTPNGLFVGSRFPTLSEIESLADLEAMQFKPDSDGHLFLLTPDEIRGLLEGAGLRPVVEKTFGSPTVSGYLKFRHLSGLGLGRLCYLGEQALECLPTALRARFASHLLVAAQATARSQAR